MSGVPFPARTGTLPSEEPAKFDSGRLWDRARVWLSEERIDALATVLRHETGGSTSLALKWDDDRFWLAHASAEDQAQYLAVGNSLNFRFWTRTEAGMSPTGGMLQGDFLVGSTYMWRRLRLIIERDEYPLLDANALAALDQDQLEALLADDSGGNPLHPGLSERLANLRDLGAVLGRDWGGRFHNLLNAASEDLDAFFALSATIRAFNDPLRKLSSVNAIMLSGTGLVRFRQTIPPAIDYHVAKQLLRMGVVLVDEQLEADLCGQQLLESAAGMSIRAASLAALEQVCERTGLPGDLVDNILWSNRHICAEPVPHCQACPLRSACQQRTEIQRPLELTRFY
jgi:Potential Queuosine, Q, salvage protein family